MHFFSTLGLALTTGAALTAAQGSAFIRIQNRCPETVYVVYDNEQYQGQRATLVSGQRLGIVLSGLGYSIGLSTTPNFYAAAEPKLILGYSVNDDNGLIYYSLSANYGNPLPGRPLSITGNGCPSVTSANGVTYASSDNASFLYTLC